MERVYDSYSSHRPTTGQQKEFKVRILELADLFDRLNFPDYQTRQDNFVVNPLRLSMHKSKYNSLVENPIDAELIVKLESAFKKKLMADIFIDKLFNDMQNLTGFDQRRLRNEEYVRDICCEIEDIIQQILPGYQRKYNCVMPSLPPLSNSATLPQFTKDYSISSEPAAYDESPDYNDDEDYEDEDEQQPSPVEPTGGLNSVASAARRCVGRWCGSRAQEEDLDKKYRGGKKKKTTRRIKKSKRSRRANKTRQQKKMDKKRG